VKRYQVGAHTKHDLKVHLVWIPKYRKKVLTGQVAIRVRDLIRQITMEHEIAILSWKIASDHIHVLVAYRPHAVVVYCSMAHTALPFPQSITAVLDAANCYW